MAKTRAVKELLATAVELTATIDNEELHAGIQELSVIEDANGSTPEFKDLRALVASLQDGSIGNTPTEPKKLDYSGVRMIGCKWYCEKDNYRKGCDSADECAEYFNG
jgi:hypothetical protein